MRKARKLVLMEDCDERSRNWVHARTPKITDEDRVIFEGPELPQVADKIKRLGEVEKMGFFKDQLSRVFGNSEHSDDVQGVSSKLNSKEDIRKDTSTYKKSDKYQEGL
uniref:Uncharacterized protein n=1 Tax=Oryza punctata TaxID=4537 RepID=A0A0E0L165_ORYPU